MIRNQKGFTLLELIISITLMALVVTISVNGFRLAYRSIDKIEMKTEEMERMRSFMSIIDAQVRSLIYTLESKDTEKINYIVGDSNSFQFVSNTSLWDRESGYVLVKYKVQSDDRGKFDLFVSESQLNGESALSAHLLKGWDRISFDYSYADTILGEDTWHTGFSEKVGTPKVVRITLQKGSIVHTYNLMINDIRRIDGNRP
ncbi:MAG: prepilin-type N-terminal cleavage/methylation domain-containing protein [Thermodesulfovibrionales bacterium]|nr:prepilin-type N-terminal cleavage/methylation domain-containing protein [Thermodesulfovibrionales bacterium]